MRMVFRECPQCTSTQSQVFLRSADHSVTKELFNIVQCINCKFLFTNPIPPEAEIGKYYKSDNYISHSDTKTGLINQLYHSVRKITLVRKRKLVYQINKEVGSLLDIGCGTGSFLSYCNKNKWLVDGVEPDALARELAQSSLGKHIYKEIKEINSPSRYNIITLWHVLEHIYDINECIIKIKSLLKDDGHLIVAVPNYESYDAIHYQNYWAAYDLPRHLYHFSKKSLTDLMVKHHLTVVKILPMAFDAFYVSLLSEKYRAQKSSIGSLIRPFFIALKSNLHGSVNQSSLIYIIKKNNVSD